MLTFLKIKNIIIIRCILLGGVAVQNSDRFLTAFNRIDHTMRDIVEAKGFMAFYRLIDQAKNKSPFGRIYEDDLRSFADLRNAIVNNRTSMEYVIAEPHTEIVEKMSILMKQLLNQSSLDNCFVSACIHFKQRIQIICQ